MASECEKGYRCSPILSLKDGSEAEASLEKVRTQNEVFRNPYYVPEVGSVTQSNRVP